MLLRAGLLLIVGAIFSKCVLNEASAAAYTIDEIPSAFTNFRRRPEVTQHAETVNGKPIKIEDYPFMVSIISNIKDTLGQGSIIGARWVLTAAHLFVSRKRNITDAQIKNGMLLIFSNTSQLGMDGTVLRKVVRFYNHERYNLNTLDYDISVVKADSDFYGVYEKTVAFADPAYYYKSYSAALVLGWNYWVLATAKVFITPQRLCQKMYKNDTITSRKVCAHGWGQGGCTYDDGGALYQHGKIIGVLSSYSCTADQKLSINVFTRISEFNSFILRITSDTGYI